MQIGSSSRDAELMVLWLLVPTLACRKPMINLTTLASPFPSEEAAKERAEAREADHR